MEQITVDCVIMRGGTSKGLYFHRDDLPPEGAERDRVLKRLMGSPDILQIDGLGGSRPVTSKVAIVAVSERDGADVDYPFGQVDIERDLIGYVGTLPILTPSGCVAGFGKSSSQSPHRCWVSLEHGPRLPPSAHYIGTPT